MSVRPSGISHSVTLWENLIFSADIEDLQMQFLVKISLTFALHSIYCFVRLSIDHASKDKNLILKVL